MTTVVRRDFRSIPHRDAAATWTAIIDLLTTESGDVAKRNELMAVTGIACCVIADLGPLQSPIVVTCDGPRTRIYCRYDDEAIDNSGGNEARLGFDALKGDWQVSLPVAQADLAWVRSALRNSSHHVVARDIEDGIEVAIPGQPATNALELDLKGFMKS